MNHLLSRISIDPNVCYGKPCIRGARIWVSLILDFLANGTTSEEVLEDYPHLHREDVLAAIAYGAEMSRENYVELPGRHRVNFKLDENFGARTFAVFRDFGHDVQTVLGGARDNSRLRRLRA